MPRNASGVYSLPVASYVAGTTIKSADMNSNLSDIATALTQSLGTTGVSAMTGPLQLASGAANAPGLVFSSDTLSGWYFPGAGQWNWVSSGSTVLALASTGAIVTGTFRASGATTLQSTLAVTGIATFSTTVNISAGGLNVTGATTFNTAATLKAALILGAGGSFDSSTVFVGSGGSHTIGTVPDAGASAGVTRFLREDSTWSATTMATLPTTQRFTSGSANYTPTANVTKIRVRMCGGGGGGGAETTNAGQNGGDTSFGTWTAIHGNGGPAGNNNGTGGAGGTGGVNGTGNLVVRVPGGAGMGIAQANINWLVGGGAGGTNPFGGAGASVSQGTGGVGAPNTGAGGAGGGVPNAQANPGNGGGASEYVEFWVNAPGVIAYVVGGAGSGGTAGGVAGGAGAAGIIIVEEFYN